MSRSATSPRDRQSWSRRRLRGGTFRPSGGQCSTMYMPACAVMLYLDDIAHVEVGVELIAPCVLDDPVVRSALPAGEVAMTVHQGPYQDLGVAHDRVKRWCTDNGRALAGPRWEIYGDWRENPADLETEVYYLLS